MGLVIVINLPYSYTDSIIQGTFLTTKPMCWALVGIHQRTPRDSGFAGSVGSSVVIKTENALRSGGRGRRDLEQFATSQCSFLSCAHHQRSVLSIEMTTDALRVTTDVVRR